MSAQKPQGAGTGEGADRASTASKSAVERIRKRRAGSAKDATPGEGAVAKTGATAVADQGEEPTLEASFERLRSVLQERTARREAMLRTFRNLAETTIVTLRGFNVFSVEEWDGGFSFSIGDFGFVVQLSEFDDGRNWPITIWTRHEDVEVWKRIDEGEVVLSADAEGQVIYGSEALTIERFLARGLFTLLADALKTYTVTEEDAEEGWTDEDLFED